MINRWKNRSVKNIKIERPKEKKKVKNKGKKKIWDIHLTQHYPIEM